MPVISVNLIGDPWEYPERADFYHNNVRQASLIMGAMGEIDNTFRLVFSREGSVFFPEIIISGQGKERKITSDDPEINWTVKTENIVSFFRGEMIVQTNTNKAYRAVKSGQITSVYENEVCLGTIERAFGLYDISYDDAQAARLLFVITSVKLIKEIVVGGSGDGGS